MSLVIGIAGAGFPAPEPSLYSKPSKLWGQPRCDLRWTDQIHEEWIRHLSTNTPLTALPDKHLLQAKLDGFYSMRQGARK